MNGQMRYLRGRNRPSALRAVAWVFGAIASLVAAVIGVVMAVVFAASLVVASLFALVVIGLVVAVLRARRVMRPPEDDDLIEARNIGGHSWVAYGWDSRR